MNNMDLKKVAHYAHAVGPSIIQLYKGDYLKTAKVLELQVHPYFLRDDKLRYTNNPIEEHIYYLNHEYKIDGLQVEYPHTTFTIFEEYALGLLSMKGHGTEHHSSSSIQVKSTHLHSIVDEETSNVEKEDK